MKKIALVLALLMVIGMGAAFAQVDVYFGGSAETDFIYDLDDNGYALANKIWGDIALTFGGDVERTGEGDVYGMITISNLSLTQEYFWGGADGVDVDEAAVNAVSNGHWSTNPSWTAKIVAGDFWVKVDGEEKIRARREIMASMIDYYTVNVNVWGDNHASFTAAGTMSMGYTIADTASFAVKVGTANATATVDNDFGMALDASLLAVENLNVDASFVYATDDTLGAGITVGYKVAAGDMTLTPFGAFDYNITASSYDVGGGAKLDWASDKDGVVNDAAGAWKGFFGSQKMVNSGAAVAARYSSGSTDIIASAGYLPIDNMNTGLYFELVDLSSTAFGMYADYTVPSVLKGYGWFKYNDAFEDMLVGAEYLGIPNTKIGAKYEYSDNVVTAYCSVSGW